MLVVISAERGTHVAVPGRYARVAIRPITDYRADVEGVHFENRNLAEIKSAIRSKLRKRGHTGRISFTVIEA